MSHKEIKVGNIDPKLQSIEIIQFCEWQINNLRKGLMGLRVTTQDKSMEYDHCVSIYKLMSALKEISEVYKCRLSAEKVKYNHIVERGY